MHEQKGRLGFGIAVPCSRYHLPQTAKTFFKVGSCNDQDVFKARSLSLKCYQLRGMESWQTSPRPVLGVGTTEGILREMKSGIRMIQLSLYFSVDPVVVGEYRQLTAGGAAELAGAEHGAGIAVGDHYTTTLPTDQRIHLFCRRYEHLKDAGSERPHHMPAPKLNTLEKHWRAIISRQPRDLANEPTSTLCYRYLGLAPTALPI